MKNNIIQTIENEQIANKAIVDFSPGDTVVVQIKVKEGNRERLQAFEGVVIAKRNRGVNSSFTVRKLSHGEGVERVFQTYSPTIASIEVKRRGDVRQAKLYYLRGLTGKKARIKEDLKYKPKEAVANSVSEALPKEKQEEKQTAKTETNTLAEKVAKETHANNAATKTDAEQESAPVKAEAKVDTAKKAEENSQTNEEKK